MKFRKEHDALGQVDVPSNRYWGAQTQRSFQNFPIGNDKMPMEVIYAFAILKKAAAVTNCKMGKLDEERCQLISQVCDEILLGKLDEHFPLSVWQTGSGTQTNMNVNEVISNRGNEIAGEILLHPNDTVNMSQSSNDTFPTAMHISAVKILQANLIPALKNIISTCKKLEEQNSDIIKIGRTHLQDATPIRFSQEISGWRGMLENSLEQIQSSCTGLYKLALGGTAVGTGINAPAGFDASVAASISELTGLPFCTDPNKFHALTSKDALVFSHGALKALAANMMKIANDVRWLSSGPRCGIGEIKIPENEPGSSIMPGKINPTQCESVTMVAVQVMANDTAVGIAASQGNFQLNVFMPVIILNYLHSARILSDSINSFEMRCLRGIVANRDTMERNLHRSLMLATCLNSAIGYENAAQASLLAYKKNLSLKEAVLHLGLLTDNEFDKLVKPEKMV
ncbi:MAG: class II fumarate hydratase [Clostridia bacterium]|jgi:fumarate hydratase class II|nr:class II fumarate hydratase [Clostridia bacterium]MCI2015099.1 class II fumarate hydratase [Clostridia bacterium]